MRGWRSAVDGFIDPDHDVEMFNDAADHFAADVYPDELGPEGWSSINIDLWAKYFRARATVAEIVRTPERVPELVEQAHGFLAGTDEGWTNPQVTCFRIVIESLHRLFDQGSADFCGTLREELLRAARFSGVDESSTQALLFLDEIADALEEVQRTPSGALVSGKLRRALQTLGRVPLFGADFANAVGPAVGVRAYEALLGRQLTWIYRPLESITDEAILRQVLLRLFQASPPLYAQLRHGPIEHGKDIAVLTQGEGEVLLRMYQVKAGHISKQNWPSAKQELEEIFQVPMQEVQLPDAPDRVEAVLVFNGHLNPYVEPVVNGWLAEEEQDHNRVVTLMHLDDLVRWIIDDRLVNEFRAALREVGVPLVD
jgi:hypothetical protein